MIDKKSILAQFAKSKKPMPSISVEVEPSENEMEGEDKGEGMGSEMKCPCCGEMIVLSAAKKEAAPKEQME